MSETYISKPIDLSIINELKDGINIYKKALTDGISFREVSLAHRELQQKASKLIESRNKSIENAIPSKAFDKAVCMVTALRCNCSFHVQLDSEIEGLINEALRLSDNFYESYLVYK